jgi:hypothetical protein
MKTLADRVKELAAKDALVLPANHDRRGFYMNDTVTAMARFVFNTSKEARDRGVLSMWTIYDHPADYPDTYVARRGEAQKGSYLPTTDVITGELAEIREAMEMCGLYCIPRAEVDPMPIVEVWT